MQKLTFFVFVALEFPFTVFTAVGSIFFIRQYKDLLQLLLNGSDAAGVFAADDVPNLLGEGQGLLLNDFSALDDIYCNIPVDKAQDIQIQGVGVTFYLQDVFLSHFIAAGVFDNGNAAVQLVQLQVVVQRKAHAGLDVIQYKAFGNRAYIQHTSTSNNVRIKAMRTYTPYWACLKYAALGSSSTSTEISFTRGRGWSTSISLGARAILDLSNM